MKGIISAGGAGMRLYSITKTSKLYRYITIVVFNVNENKKHSYCIYMLGCLAKWIKHGYSKQVLSLYD